MKILVVGGGSGGHVTPIAATLNALALQTDVDSVRVWCDRQYYAQVKKTMQRVAFPLRIEKIASGKFRRYHSLPVWKQLMRISTIVIPNMRDGILVVCGSIQSIWKLLWWRPDVIFCKGGYVCLPVGIAGVLLRIPIVIHDSDTHPGLTNRILARWATSIATGAPLEYYSYPKEISAYVGIPIDERYKPYTHSERSLLKQRLGFASDAPLVVVTGGGLGAESINTAVVESLPDLLAITQIALISGARHHESLDARTTAYHDKASFRLYGFVGDTMPELLAAADIVIARAGATTMLELSALHKPTILIPNPYLTGGHQIKNAQAYEKTGAAVVLSEHAVEQNPTIIVDAIAELLGSAHRMNSLATSIALQAKPDAAKDVADMIRAAGIRSAK